MPESEGTLSKISDLTEAFITADFRTPLHWKVLELLIVYK